MSRPRSTGGQPSTSAAAHQAAQPTSCLGLASQVPQAAQQRRRVVLEELDCLAAVRRTAPRRCRPASSWPVGWTTCGFRREPSRRAERRPCRPIQHPHQRPVPHLLSLDFGRRRSRRDRGLPLGVTKDGDKLNPVTPGELLLEEFLRPMGISQYRLAKEIGVPAQRIGEIVAGRRAITADTDLRLCRSSVFPTATGCAPRRPTTPRSQRRRWPISWLTSGHGQGPLP